jgi:predicted transcriptional regulator
MALFNKTKSTEPAPCPSLGPLELDILKLVWNEPSCSVRCILVKLNENRSKKEKLAYTTVMTIMKRLLDKGLLKRAKESRSYMYQATQKPHEFIGKVVNRAINDVVQLYGSDAISAFKQQVEHL